MSNYTTEVRFICESLAGKKESVGADSVDSVIDKSWDKIFTTKAPFFDEEYRKPLCKKILKHFYLREIGADTFGIWKLWMNTRLEEIMPFYNQLYKSELLEFNPLYDVDLKKTYTKNIDGETSNTNTINDKGKQTTAYTDTAVNSDTKTESVDDTTTSNVTRASTDRYSDTPQGTVGNLSDNTYLTNARIVDGSDDTDATSNRSATTTDNGTNTVNHSGTSNAENDRSEKLTGTSNTVEEYTDSIIGKTAGQSYSRMIQEFRETFLNIDLQVIHEFDDLFFGLW